ncbi:MAG: sulfurtransferase [Bacteroidales bacterium]|nr:sulfurtransferase [Candidatus Latescibacterota bacterium]
MSLRNCLCRLSIFMAALIFIAGQGISETKPGLNTNDTMGTLVTADWLSRHLDDPDLVILDCTVRIVPKEGGGMDAMSGRGDYEKGHIPSAQFADLMGDLSDVDSPMSYTLPTPEQFCAAMGALGVGDDSRVVLYDSYGSVWAARVWWMLRWAGFDNAALLDGGFRAWTAGGRPLSTEVVKPQMKMLTADPRPALIADRDEVFAAIEDDAVSLIDAMHKPHFTGQMVMYGRPGHIPGAVNIPAMSLLDETGNYQSHDDLATMHEGDREGRVITYCGAGIAASSNAFILLRLGFTDVAVYMASLQEWAADAANPLVVD